MDALQTAALDELEDLCNNIGELIIDYIKTEFVRPLTGRGFTDRTHRLRNSLRAQVQVLDYRVRLNVSSTVPYALYVETIRNGTYAYMGPAIEEKMPQIQTMILYRMNIEQLGKRRNLSQLAKNRGGDFYGEGSNH